ncbi:MAG: biotin--[acetyl-CoA-carboxylase] ligase [Saccharofermentanales bacterium]
MTDENILTILQKTSDFVSGEWISGNLHISRTAVWKAINKLKSKGYAIESVPNRGYRLVSSADILSGNELKPLYHTRMLGRQILYFNECLSTNDETKTGDLRGDAEGTVYITDLQTKGRGRLGRDWHDECKKGIAMSFLLKPSIPPSLLMPVSLIAGLAVCKAIVALTGLQCGLKWPNDVIANGRKIAGVLIEMTTSGESVESIIVGIGVNCNNTVFPDYIRSKATSIYLETGTAVSRKMLVCRILEHFENDYFKWLDEMTGLDESAADSGIYNHLTFLNEYKALCLNLGKEVVIRQKDQIITGIAEDINPKGELKILLPNGDVRLILSGEVSLRGILGYV